jgi:hypothetical protein
MVFRTEFSADAIHKRSFLHQELSKVPDNDIESYLELNGDASAIMDNSDPGTLNSLPSANDQSETN